MKRLLVVYHSMTGGALMMAQALADAATEEPELEVLLLHAARAQTTDVLEADGYVFVTPETLGSMSGLMKDFFDRTYYRVIDRIAGRPYAVLVCAGSDGVNAVRQIQRIVTGWRLKPMTDPLIVCTHAQTAEAILQSKLIEAEDLQRCRDIGQAFAAGLIMGMF